MEEILSQLKKIKIDQDKILHHLNLAPESNDADDSDGVDSAVAAAAVAPESTLDSTFIGNYVEPTVSYDTRLRETILQLKLLTAMCIMLS